VAAGEGLVVHEDAEGAVVQFGEGEAAGVEGDVEEDVSDGLVIHGGLCARVVLRIGGWRGRMAYQIMRRRDETEVRGLVGSGWAAGSAVVVKLPRCSFLETGIKKNPSRDGFNAWSELPEGDLRQG
jgi:hypothetical protein